MPNPSTVASGRHDELQAFLDTYHNLNLSKETRETALRHIRQIEDELDLPEAERTPAHNAGGKHEQSPSDDGSLRLKKLLDFIAIIERDDDGDAMLDADGLDHLQELARNLRK